MSEKVSYPQAHALSEKAVSDLKNQIVATFKTAMKELIKSPADAKIKETEVDRVTDAFVNFSTQADKFSNTFA